MKFPGKKANWIIFVVLLVCLAGLLSLNYKKHHPAKSITGGSSEYPAPLSIDSSTSDDDHHDTLGFPVAPGSSDVSSVLIHYFFSGNIKSLKATSEGEELTLDTKNSTIPVILIARDTRVSKISPPYGQSTSVSYPVSKLKTGIYVEVSAEYDLSSKNWFIRDVFLPTDKNTNL